MLQGFPDDLRVKPGKSFFDCIDRNMFVKKEAL